MTWLLVPLALAAGFVLPVQFAVNAQLRTYAGGPFAAATISFLVGTVALVAATLVSREHVTFGKLGDAPWWAWLGGVLGAFYLTASIVLAPRLGAGTTVALIVGGQMLAALVIDQFGLLRLPVHHAGPLRVLGAALVVAGVTLIRVF
jgi:bacterial/archaeal transporter family-2 protein